MYSTYEGAICSVRVVYGWCNVMSEREVSWGEIFAYDLPTPKVETKRKCACGGRNCQTAKRIKCVCRCHSEFHGAANRRGMEPLEKALGLEKEVPQRSTLPLGDLALSRELSGLAEVEGEI
jgi:hypothetical protein